MAYTPINWQTGDTITAEKMNKMDNGWSVDLSQLFSETVTTVAGEFGNVAELTYASPITADSIIVTFDGIEYACSSVIIDGDSYGYGGVDSSWTYDFSQYPFAIVSGTSENILATQTAGTHTISMGTASVEVSNNFRHVVNQCVDTSTMPMLCVSGTTTRDDMVSAMRSGRILCFHPYGSQIANIYIITSVRNDFVVFFPTDSNVQTSFVDGVFTVTTKVG